MTKSMRVYENAHVAKAIMFVAIQTSFGVSKTEPKMPTCPHEHLLATFRDAARFVSIVS